MLRRGGDWADVPMVEGGYIINIGDLLMRWTNDRWVSTIHRVVNPPDEVRRSTDRMSIAFFFVPNHDVEVSCIESCMSDEQPASLRADDSWWPLARENPRSPSDRREGELILLAKPPASLAGLNDRFVSS